MLPVLSPVLTPATVPSARRRDTFKSAGRPADGYGVSVSTSALPATPVGSRATGPWPVVGAPVVAHLPDVAVVATLAWWATYLTWGTGGREPHVLSVGCLLLACAFVVVRPWRVLPPLATGLALAVGLGALVVVLTAPTGWAGGDDAASYAFAAELGLVVLAWARTPGRRLLLLTGVLGAAGAEFAMGWLPWWGMQDPMKLFEGTFYWHNQVGAFLAAGAVLGLGAIAAGRPAALLGWTTTPLCVAGTVFSTSRGSQMALGLGALLLLALLRRRHLHVVGGLVVSWLVTMALSGPPFFAERVAPTAATEARSASLVGNGVQRFEDWRRAFRIFEHWPLSGAGFNSFDSATSVATTRHDTVGTAFAHNGYLQAAADGGLVLTVPLVALLALVVLVVLRGLPGAVRERDAVRLSGAAALVVLLLHSGMDFDWTYPALLALLAPVAVLALPQVPATPPAGRRLPRGLGVAFAATGVVLLLVGAVAGWHGGLDLNAAV